MDKKSREFEQIHLRTVLEIVEKANAVTLESKAELDEKIEEWKRKYDDENVELFMQLVVGTDRQEQLHKLLGIYKRALNAPYFGRVDFQEDGERRQRIYIGRGAITENNELLVVDWRTPVANLYYDGESGRAAYTAPDGEISGEMSLKRTYNISGGELLDYYDADMVTNDELLQEYLAKNADVVLRDIVATIQADQNEIIRVEPWRNVIVQGVAGSGKTTVALHRLAWLIFNQKMGENRYLIIGTNRMFLNYVSGMLPDLGVESIRQMMMKELFLYTLFYDEGKCVITQTDHRKSTKAFAESLTDFMDGYQRRFYLERDLVLEDEVFLSREEIAENFELKPLAPMRERADRFRELLEYRVKMRLAGVLQRIEDRYDVLLGRCNTPEEKGRMFDEKYAHLARAKAAARTLPRTYLKQLKTVTEKRIYGDFLKAMQENADVSTVKMLKATALNIKKDVYDLYDLAALLFISAQLDSNSRVAEFEHIVIDEAQDFGPMAYRALSRAFPHARFTVLGDLAQNIHGDAGLAAWEEIEDLFPNLYFHALTKSYRNTIEIAEFANRILDHIGTGYEITPVVRHGREVRFQQAADFSECAALAVDAVKNSARHGSAAIICRDTEEAVRAYEAIGEEMGAVLLKDDTFIYEGGAVIAPVGLVKGLEFDTVVVFDAGAEKYAADAATAKQLYVALTRALHELNIFYTGEYAEVLKK